MAHKFSPANLAKLENPERGRLFSPPDILRRCGDLSGRTILDIGVGSGFFLPSLVEAAGPQGKVYGLDISAEMLDHVRFEKLSKLKYPIVELLPAEESRIPLSDRAADLAWLCFLYHELEHPVKYLRELKRVVAAGGHICIIDWNDRERPMGPPPTEVVPRSGIERHARQAGLKVTVSESLGDSCELVILSV